MRLPMRCSRFSSRRSLIFRQTKCARQGLAVCFGAESLPANLREKVHILPEEALQTVAGNLSENAEAEAWEREYTLQQMRDSMARLSAEQQTVLDLFYLQKKSYAEVQEATGYTFGQVKSFIQNGKRALRLLLLSKRSL